MSLKWVKLIIKFYVVGSNLFLIEVYFFLCSQIGSLEQNLDYIGTLREFDIDYWCIHIGLSRLWSEGLRRVLEGIEGV